MKTLMNAFPGLSYSWVSTSAFRTAPNSTLPDAAFQTGSAQVSKEPAPFALTDLSFGETGSVALHQPDPQST